MRAGARIALLVLSCVLVIPTIADAKVKLSPTQIALVGADFESIRAELHSPLKGCLRERTVSLTDLGTGAVFHTTTTARDGRFSIALGDIPYGISAFRVSVAPKRIGSRLCEQDAADVAFDEATLTGGPNNGAFRGALSSNVDACEPNRMISLYEISSDPVFVGWNLTDGSGAWVIAQAGGTYEARADPALVGGGDAFTYCRPVVSPAWSFEEPPPESP